MKLRFFVGLAGLAGIFANLNGCGGSSPTPVGPNPTPTATPAPTPDFALIMAAGDISCDSATPSLPCKAKETSDLMLEARDQNPTSIVLPLGDLQYENGTLTEFNASYERTWGRLNENSHPVPGNHEYQTRSAQGYFDYFQVKGVSTGTSRLEGWYAYDFAGWRFYALNSNCDSVGGCQSGSAQYRWLQSDLAANRKTCMVAYMHYPLFSAGTSGNNPTLQPLMSLLYTAGVDIVLAGHDHDYERFAPMTDAGVSDPQRGFRLFVVGTGGRDQTPFVRAPHPLSLVRINDHFGILKIEFKSASYRWKFTDISGSVIDTDTATCTP